MYDDDNWEIRSLVIDKLSSLKNFDLIDTGHKIRILFIGLSDKNEKVKSSAKRFFKHYLNFLGIITDKNQPLEENKDSMVIDENLNDVTFRSNKIKLDEDDEESSPYLKEKGQTVDEKIDNALSPLKLKKRQKIQLSPAILFDKLNFINYYFNPKYSYVFQLVTEALIESSSLDSLTELFEGIVNHIMTASNTVLMIKSENTRKSIEPFEGSNYSLLYEILFLQSTTIVYIDSIKLLNNNNGKNDHYTSVNNKLNDILPDTRTLAKIIEYFFVEKCSPLILHQLLLISNYFTYIDEVGNRDMQNVIIEFLSDVNLDRKALRSSLTNINKFKTEYSGMKDIKIDDEDEEEIDISNNKITKVIL
jgi:hypothetical protein